MSPPPANRFPGTFAALRERDEAAFVPFLMAGDGGIDTTERLLDAVVEAGADVIELGAGKDLVVCLSGRGDKDMETVAARLGVKLR